MPFSTYLGSAKRKVGLSKMENDICLSKGPLTFSPCRKDWEWSMEFKQHLFLIAGAVWIGEQNETELELKQKGNIKPIQE